MTDTASTTAYADAGCDVSPSCLRCPLPQCKYDDRAWKRRDRDREVRLILKDPNANIHTVAARFGLTTRTVSRISKDTSV
jgi:hypothetical protein